ncbi:hypothetical protein L841_2556 [Mycobacterium sp. MAC_080597_8934]|nr:hypothetical protein L839_1375 [Mycobacterium avium MAV_120809_2495]ETZ50483.1 hypothetical protein L837_1247 [Mycobacterium avium MAV_061107_1842]ETZ56643.1 hypothetical protein L840_3824 [Mycobacterium sp. MAC_011194_8550]ETZ67557.1 hypothetical protein L841_2556 [Mycobacterium sp. MAC_080597_8934]
MHRGTGLRGRPPPRRRGPRGSRCSRAGAALADVGLPAHRRRAIDRLATDGETAQGRHHRVGRRHSAQPQNPPSYVHRRATPGFGAGWTGGVFGARNHPAHSPRTADICFPASSAAPRGPAPPGRRLQPNRRAFRAWYRQRPRRPSAAPPS